MIKIQQGESYPIYITLTQDGVVLTPDLVVDLKVCIGDALSKTYSAGDVKFDEEMEKWYIWPTQQETIALSEDSYSVQCHVKYQDGSLLIVTVGRIHISESCCGEVF